MERRLILPAKLTSGRCAIALPAFGLSLLLAAGAAASAGSVAFAQQKKEAQRAGEEDKPPRVLSKVDPQYTQRARDEKIEGTVLLSVEISEEGHAEQIRVRRGLHPDLDDAAVVAVQQWRFAPGRKKGKPVRVPVCIEVNFRLR